MSLLKQRLAHLIFFNNINNIVDGGAWEEVCLIVVVAIGEIYGVVEVYD